MNAVFSADVSLMCRALDVNKRCCYIDGAGQLCRDCYLELLRERRPIHADE